MIQLACLWNLAQPAVDVPTLIQESGRSRSRTSGPMPRFPRTSRSPPRTWTRSPWRQRRIQSIRRRRAAGQLADQPRPGRSRRALGRFAGDVAEELNGRSGHPIPNRPGRSPLRRGHNRSGPLRRFGPPCPHDRYHSEREHDLAPEEESHGYDVKEDHEGPEHGPEDITEATARACGFPADRSSDGGAAFGAFSVVQFTPHHTVGARRSGPSGRGPSGNVGEQEARVRTASSSPERP